MVIAGACTLTSTASSFALSSASDHKITTLTTVVAPAAPEDAERLPLDIVAVVDRSGSMAGEKMALVKQTLQLLAQRTGLTSNDRLGIVSFDNVVKVELPLAPTDAAGRARAAEVAAKLRTGGATNLSGGLLQGIDMVATAAAPSGGKGGLRQLFSRPPAAPAGTRTRAVLLFTDGIANHGITDARGLVEAAVGAMGETPMTLFTFGFGADHQEDTLRALAEATEGIYYYITKADDIPAAFADCVGGLVSVVAQNAVLTLEPPAGAAVIDRVLGRYKTSPASPAAAPGAAPAAAPGSAFVVELGDLYAEDEKDVLAELTLPAAAPPADAPADAGARPDACLVATLRYFCVASSRVETATATVAVARPLETPDEPVLTPDEAMRKLRLDEQRNRVLVADAMAEAARLADEGQLADGRGLLGRVAEEVRSSKSAASPLCAALLDDVARVEGGYESQAQYRCVGSKMSKMTAMSHAQQRSNHMSAGIYEKKSKMRMKSMWG